MGSMWCTLSGECGLHGRKTLDQEVKMIANLPRKLLMVERPNPSEGSNLMVESEGQTRTFQLPPEKARVVMTRLLEVVNREIVPNHGLGNRARVVMARFSRPNTQVG